MGVRLLAVGALSLALTTTALGGQAAARQAVATKTDYYVVNFSPNGAQFIDVAGMQIKGSDAMYWTTVVMPGSQDHAYSMWLNHLDCAGRRTRVLMANFYSAQGAQLRSVAGPTDWKPITAGSSGETFIDIACKGTRPGEDAHLGEVAPVVLYEAFQKSVQTPGK